MKNIWKSALTGSAFLAATLAVSGNAFAVESSETVSVDTLSSDSVQLAQVTNVSELSDVLPSDWAYTALQRLVEEYGCLEGYPDRTFRGNRAMTRYEFAAGLNACLDVVVQLIGDQSELDTIRRLQEQFAAELATLRGRVDTLEADVAELQANQFSTTTKLRGAIDAHLVVPFDGLGVAVGGVGPDDNTTFEYRSSLNFDTSFTGEDRLRVRFRAGSDSAGTALAGAGGLANAGNGGANAAFNANDNVRFDDVYYTFPVGSRTSVTIAGNSIVADDFVTSTIVPFDGPSVADFGGPVFYDAIGIGGGDAGLGVNFALTENFILDLGYATANGSNAGANAGLFDGYEYIAQLNYLSDGIIDAAVTYMDGEPATGTATIDYIVAGLLSLDFGRFELGGYYALVEPTAGNTVNDAWQAGISVPDFLSTGNTFGAYAGNNTAGNFIAEGYYAVDVNDYLTITPAIIYGDLNSGVAGADDTSIYGAIRTTLKF